ncbi:hypothetical protein Poli38472_000829 [Pythium oligandrum]|uniref:Uncharacterized protein n=1 Tax=Pythium oligandrum TaxID=41045 RepID=A0A8K1CCM6_PYTOL|nr:hypothetical protein Poli38472_000829 [Pythium oligandrum]|eukprot:TMW60787.1 hypothetical protein Poli38472_000829 [Pythium oligandrum]
MGAKGKSRKKKDEQKELEEEAMAEWLARGFNLQDFTTEKMMAVWMEEDGADEDEDGEEALSAKQELIRSMNVLGPVIEQAKETVARVKETVKEEAIHAVQTAWQYAEIPYFKRRRLLREHVVHVHEMDRESQKYSIIRQRVNDDWESAQEAEKELQFGLIKRNQRKAPLLHRMREMKEEADQEQHARIMADIEQKRRERKDKELAKKHRLRVEREEFAEKQRVHRRQMNMRFWKKQYTEAKEYAEQHSLAVDQSRQDAFDAQVASMKQEIAEMNGEQAEDERKDLDRAVMSSSLGLYGTALAPGEWNSAIDGDDREGTDENTVGLFSARGYQAENELLRIELMEADSKVMMLREKLEQLDQVKTNLLADKRTLMDRKDMVLVEIKQINQENEELNRLLAGPPRRDPNEEDRMQFHLLMTRRGAQTKQLQELNTRQANVQKRMELAERSEKALIVMLEAAESRAGELQEQVQRIDAKQTDLPVVIGRSIQHNNGVLTNMNGTDCEATQMTASVVNPTQLYTQVTMASKLEILKEAAQPVKEHFKKVKNISIEDWKTRELRTLEQQELEVTKNRLANLRDQLINHRNDSLRADLMQAIIRFHQGPLKLRACIFPVKGRFEWWQYHDPKRSFGLTHVEERGLIYLEPSVRSGQIRGCIRLPKSCFFRIALRIVAAQVAENGEVIVPATEDDQDEIAAQTSEILTFYVGSDYDSLQEHIFRDISGKALTTGYLAFEFFGARLCFCFEFKHRMGNHPDKAAYRLVVVSDAQYEERLQDFREEETRMRLVQKEKHVVSQLVKTLRMQTKKTSSERCAGLLQELIEVEKSKAKMWDSTLLHGHQQRFLRLEYARMLRLEIKRELAHQIDEDVLRRRGRLPTVLEQSVDSTRDTSESTGAQVEKENRKDASRLEFLARKYALVEPQYLKEKESLGEYCSFKTIESGAHKRSSGDSISYRKEALIMGLRFEWREGRTKLHVMHKLCGPTTSASRSDTSESSPAVKSEWCPLEKVNAVFLQSACAKALQERRQEMSKERTLVEKREEQVSQLQRETQATLQLEREAEKREKWEDTQLHKQKTGDLARREKLFYADAIRTTTYNQQVSSQMEFLAQRKKSVVEQHSSTAAAQNYSLRDALNEVKEEYAKQFVDGRLALVRKTWERKEKRLSDKRAQERKERAFRIQHEKELVEEINASNEKELQSLQAEQLQRAKEQLNIPNFQLVARGAFRCEHRELKAWGSKYGSGQRCKQCGKEMAESFDEVDHERGADPQLDRDIAQDRGMVTGGPVLRLRHGDHFKQVEAERVRVEKEAREQEHSEALLYDRMDPKVIEAFNFRHGMQRQLVETDGSDPLYQRVIHEAHRADFQDEILFHGRLRNYHFRIHQINGQHAETTTMLAVQRDFLASAQEENETVLAILPLVERDHGRAVALVEEDRVAHQALEESRQTLKKTQRERERAYYALEGVEEEAEFAESHAPALIESSGEMTQIVERMRDQDALTSEQLEKARSRFADSIQARDTTENMLSRLLLRTTGTAVRTRFGFAKVLYYRQEDDTVVVSPSRWEATIFIPVEELILLETMHREGEISMMESEESSMRSVLSKERTREKAEQVLMAQEDEEIRVIVAWRTKKEPEEVLVRDTICNQELAAQFEYEVTTRKELWKAATAEAKRLHQFSRVSFKRRRQVPGASHPRPNKLDVLRVTRANEKRLAMEAMEQALLQRDKALRKTFVHEHDQIFQRNFGDDVFSRALTEIIAELCREAVEAERYEAKELHQAHSHALMVSPMMPSSMIPTRVSIGYDHLWLMKKKQCELTFLAWSKELKKLDALRLELARREEIRRLEEEERQRLERRRKEMLAEERHCREFYMAEMAQCIRERKAMASAEMEMREYLRQLELEAMKAKYAKMIEERNKANDKAARRLEIKLGKNEKHRLHREWAQIKVEDALAMQIREEERAREQAEALERQFDQYLIQQSMEGKIAAEREASRLAERIREAQRIAEERRAAFEAKLVQERMMITVETYYQVAKVELEWMIAAECVAYWERQVEPLRSNLKQMEVELKRILSEKDHVVADAQAKREHAEKCKQRAHTADLELREALQTEEEYAKTYKKIHMLNATMDSAVLHGRPQLFRTIYIRDQLHKRYFYLLTESIICRSIVECSEREAARLEERLRSLETERAFKIREINVLKRKRRRAFHMRLRRSELGKIMFGGTQRRLLKLRFQQWVQIWSQRVTVRASFEVKHGLLMQQHRIREEQTQQAQQEVTTKLSILHTHQKRRLHCRLCKQEYTEEQNNRYACSYHPGAYELACIRSCPTRQLAQDVFQTTSVSEACMMHRARRWLCCDVTDEGRYGNNGCATRFHLAVRENPALKQLAEKKETAENGLLSQFQQQLQELKERNVVGKAKAATKAVVKKIEEELSGKRAIAAKYHTLDQRR